MAITCTTSGVLGISGKTRDMSERDLLAIIAAALYALNNSADPTGSQLATSAACVCTTDDRALLVQLANMLYQFAVDQSKTTTDIEDLIGCAQCLDARTLAAAAVKQLCTYLSTR